MRPGRALALVTAVAAVLLGLGACRSGLALEAKLHAAWAAEAAVERLVGPLRSDDEARLLAVSRALFSDERYGFSFLLVRDAQGQPRISLGRFENLSLPLLGPRTRSQIRDGLYELTSHSGSVPVMDGSTSIGRVDFALLRFVQPEVERAAVLRLQQVGALGTLLGGCLLIALSLSFRNRSPAPLDAQLWRRLSPAPDRFATLPGADTTSPLSLELLTRAGIAVIVVDDGARILQLNVLAETLCGWRASEVERRLIYSVFHPVDDAGEPLPVPAEQALANGADAPPLRCRLKPRQAPSLPIEMQAVVIRRDEGGAEGAVLLFRDLRDREDALVVERAQRQHLQAIVENVDEGILTVDAKGRVRYANGSAQRLFGYTESEIIDVAMSKLMPVPFLNLPDVGLDQYTDCVEGVRPRVIGWRKDATTFAVDLRARALGDGDTQMLVVRDEGERLQRDNQAFRLSRLMEQSLDEIYVFDAQTLNFIEVNRAAQQSLGFAPAQLRRMTPLSVAPLLRPEQFQVQLSALRGGQMEQVCCQTDFQRADGSRYPVEVRMHFSPDEQPPVFVVVAVKLTPIPLRSENPGS